MYRFSNAVLGEQRMLILIIVLLQIKCKYFLVIAYRHLGDKPFHDQMLTKIREAL